MGDPYNIVYTNRINVDEWSGACLGVVSTYPPALPVIPPFDTILQIIFPWCKVTEEELINGISDLYTIHDFHWFESWSRYRMQQFIKLGYTDYLTPRATDTEIAFMEAITLIQKGYGVKDRSFKAVWKLWRAEVQRPYWIYHTGICRYGCSLDTKSAKHSFEENLITKRYSELTGEVLNGYEVSVCGCGGSKCCNMNKIYIKGKGFFFKEDACKLKLLPPEHCPYTNCWQKHGMPAMYDIP
jgi:hypothetical protein